MSGEWGTGTLDRAIRENLFVEVILKLRLEWWKVASPWRSRTKELQVKKTGSSRAWSWMDSTCVMGRKKPEGPKLRSNSSSMKGGIEYPVNRNKHDPRIQKFESVVRFEKGEGAQCGWSIGCVYDWQHGRRQARYENGKIVWSQSIEIHNCLVKGFEIYF